ncbi:hypothetical protein HYR54_09955 [Candidatus Acetothermia bacterium]|nr:hypothetical protein [Candidatus Acetothermia bacterium]
MHTKTIDYLTQDELKQLLKAIESKRAKNGVFTAPKKLVDPDDILTLEDEAALREGLAQIRRGETVPWKEVKKRLRL